MAIYSNLPVYKASYTLMVEVAKTLKDTPRDCRYTMGQDLRQKIMDLIILIYQANRLKNKIEKIQLMRDNVLQIQVLIRLMCDLRYISERKYVQLVESTTDISKQLVSWEKYERNKLK